MRSIVLTKNDKFAWDAYRRFVQMFATVVLGMRRDPFDEVVKRYVAKARVPSESDLTALAFRNMTSEFKALVRHHTKKDFPEDVFIQLRMAVEAVFNSWNSKRAIEYRRYERIPDWWGTAVNVVTMVFGNMGEDSGTGVAFTRNPSTGEKTLYGEFLQNAQGEDVVSGSRTPVKISVLEKQQPEDLQTVPRYRVKAREALSRHARHRVHGRARQALRAAVPIGQAQRGGSGTNRGRHGQRTSHQP